MKQFSKIFNRKAQSILELAIFGSIILFLFGVLLQYGLGLNYSQHITMQTFRKALALARERANTSRQVELTVVKDQSIPNPSDQFGVSETSPYIAQASAVWSEELMASYDNKLKPKADLPHVDYIINGQQKSYTIANYGYKYCGESEFDEYQIHFPKKENDLKDEYNIDGTPGSDNIYWYWTTIACGDIECGDNADVDGDGKEEGIYDLSKLDKNDPDSITTSIYYFKFQDGEIDTTKNKDLGEEPQGLQEEYTKDITINATINKAEAPSGISTSRQSSVRENIQRIIKTNTGDETVSSTANQTRSSNWQTNW